MDDTPEACDDFLTARFAPDCDPRLRQDLLRRTTNVLRRRRRLKRLGLVAALAACYLAGMATVWQLTSSRLPEDMHTERPSSDSTADLVKRPSEPAPTDRETDAPALVLEHRALSAERIQQAKLYRKAGDRYLAEAGDVQSALRCYRQALDTGSPEDLAVAAEDSWLLIALKDSRQKEKRYVQNDG